MYDDDRRERARRAARDGMLDEAGCVLGALLLICVIGMIYAIVLIILGH